MKSWTVSGEQWAVKSGQDADNEGTSVKSLMSEKSLRFAVRIVKLCDYLRTKKHEQTMSSQLLRSGTSIGANLAEADNAVSRPDLCNKQAIALKECSETIYWLDLLHLTGYLTDNQHESIRADASELSRMLTSSVKTLKRKTQDPNTQTK